MREFVFSFGEGEVGLLYCTIFLFIRDEIWFFSWFFFFFFGTVCVILCIQKDIRSG